MRAYLRGERSLLRCIFVWGLLFPILFFLLRVIVRTVDVQKDHAFSAYVMENNEMFFAIQEWITVSFAYIYLPLGILIVSQNWQNIKSERWGKILSRIYYIAASIFIFLSIQLIKNQREHPVNLNLKEAPLTYDTKWYLLFVFLIFVLYGFFVPKKTDDAFKLEELKPLEDDKEQGDAKKH